MASNLDKATDEIARDIQGTRARRMAERLETMLILLAAGALICIGALIIGQVFARYVLAAPPMWTEELTRYVFVWLAWLSAAVVFRRGQHVVIDVFTGWAPRVIHYLLNAVVRLACVLILAFMMIYGWEVLAFTRSRSAALGIPMTYVYSSAFVGSGVMILFTILDSIDSITRRLARAERR